MTETPDRNRERAEEEAAAWLVRLSEAPDDAGLREGFEAWRAGSDLHAEIWARTARAYDLLGKGPPRHGEAWQAYAAQRESMRKLPADRQRHRPILRITARRLAAAAALAACLLLALLPEVLLHMRADLVTATAELRSVVLEDGSRVQLAPESAVALRFADGERRVRLIKGEAFFEVESDPSSPFRIVAGDTVATVLGTAFEVRREGEATRVAVQHGRVQVEATGRLPSSSAELRAGEWLRAGAAGAPERGRLAPDEIAAWREGELIARDRPVGEIVDVLRRYHSGAILMTNEAFAARRAQYPRKRDASTFPPSR